MAVFGLVFGATSAATISPNDVRYGVDMGGGLFGNLVLPVVGDVRAGIEYGSHGTQFTGTLSSFTSDGTTWKDSRYNEFRDMLAEWGTTLSVGNLTAACIKTPDRILREMTPTGYLLKQVATFDIFTTEWTRLGLESRKQFDCEGTRYEIVPKSRDTSEPTIQFTAERVK